MDDSLYRFLKYTAITLTIAWIGWSVYDSFVADVHPGDSAHLAADKFFEDGNYERALQEYELALKDQPEHIYALRGKARTLMQLNRFDEALQAFNIAIAHDWHIHYVFYLCDCLPVCLSRIALFFGAGMHRD